MKYILYNPLANNGIKPDFLEHMEYIDVTGLDYGKFFDSLSEEDEVVFVGGDGTLNYFINAVDTDSIRNRVYLRPSGTGNDFMNDLNEHSDREILINDYIKNLPIVYVNGLKRKFINGIGYGIDGYCCEVADKIRESGSAARINYTVIAIKGLLFYFRKRKATLTVDGREYSFKNVWLAPTMKGRFYGGGVMVSPYQDRTGDTLSVVIYSCPSRIKSLVIFPSSFKGKHVKHKDMVTILHGKEFEVKFDEPCALQIDGETVLNVSSYRVRG